MPHPHLRRLPLWALSAAASLAALAPSNSRALIVTDETAAATPDPALASALSALGRWGNNAAAVAVADGWVLTSRHQDSLTSPPNRTVAFGDRRLRALAGEEGGQVVLQGNTDLRLVRVVEQDGTPAAFGDTLRASAAPVTEDTRVTLAGFGPGRGELNEEGDAYEHVRVAGAANANPLRSGTNTVSEVGPLEAGEDGTPGPYEGMAAIAAVFDDLPGTTEATVGIGDSGGFWLVGDAVRGYELAGITHAVEFREGEVDPVTGVAPQVIDAFFGQTLIAADATPFAARINAVPEPAAAAVLAAGGMLLLGRRRPAAGRSA